MRRLLSELRRRKVFQAAAVYAVFAIGGLELADVLVPSTRLPEWTDAFLVVLAIVGFPLVIAFAWMFDVGAGGVERTGSPAVGDRPGEGVARKRDPARGADPAGGGQIPEETRSTAMPSAARPDLDPRTVAVLPFVNLSGAADATPFAAGLQDDLLTELSRAPALTVISRTSVQAYRDTTKSMVEIGRELGAGTIVEGGVQKAGDRVRLNVQLIDARSDVHLWAERYDRELSTETIFDLQTELAGEIMERLHAALTGDEGVSESARPTANLEAYRQYSIGRVFLVERSAEALTSAAAHFEAAVKLDAEYALAWAGLSLACTLIVDYRHIDSQGVLARGESAARRALELDPQLAEAHSALGCWYSAVRECRKGLEAHTRAAELRPSYAGAHQWRCWTSLLIGDPETAVEAGARAVRLDPMDPEARGNLTLAHVGCHQEEAALAVAREAADGRPGFDWVRWPEAVALVHLGRADEGRELFRGLSEAWATHWPTTMGLLDSLRGVGETVTRVVVEEHAAAGNSFHAGLLYLALGQMEKGFDTIRSALPLEWDEVLYLRYFREWPVETHRADPRWRELLEELDRAWGA